LEDQDDEVRDRAALYLKALDDQDIAKQYVINGDLRNVAMIGQS
jgi:hypothetical protein